MSHNEPVSSAPRPPMPSILDFESPEEYSEALKSAGFLDERTEGVLTDSDGVLSRAHYRNGQLEFDDPARTLSSLYEQRRSLRADAIEHFRMITATGDDEEHPEESGYL